MKFKVDHDLHIHSKLSSCSNHPEQTAENILAYAKENGFHTICMTDHFWDDAIPGASEWYKPQNFAHISESLPLPQAEDVRFCFGCEGEMDMNFKIGISDERAKQFDFIIIPTTHMHMTGLTLSEEDAKSSERRAALWVKRFDALLNSSMPFGKVGIAHLSCALINHQDREEFFKILRLIPSDEMHRLFAAAKDKGLAIEINYGDVSCNDFDSEEILSIYKIAKHQGCKFYLGSDAHTPRNLHNVKSAFERAVDLIGLEEGDKFTLAN